MFRMSSCALVATAVLLSALGAVEGFLRAATHRSASFRMSFTEGTSILCFHCQLKRCNYHLCTLYINAEIGAQPPLGFWDPLGLLNDADLERFDRLRTVETKHGRISMLAILGHLVTSAGVRLPGEIAYGVPFASVKSGLAAFDDIPAGGTLQLVLFIGLIELGFAARKDDIEEAQIRASKW